MWCGLCLFSMCFRYLKYLYMCLFLLSFPPNKKVESKKCRLWGLKELAELVEKPSRVHNVIIPDRLLQTDGDTLSSFVYLTCWCFGRIFTPCCLQHLECLKGETLANSLRYSIVNIHASDAFLSFYHSEKKSWIPPMPIMPAPHRFERSTHTHQAREEFPGQDLMMDDVPGTPSITQWKWSTFQKSLVISRFLLVPASCKGCCLNLLRDGVFRHPKHHPFSTPWKIQVGTWLFHVFFLHLRLVIVMCLTHFLVFLRGT